MRPPVGTRTVLSPGGMKTIEWGSTPVSPAGVAISSLVVLSGTMIAHSSIWPWRENAPPFAASV